MSSDVIIKVSNLGKCYRIAHQAERQRYVALRDVIAQKAKGFFQKLKSGNSENLKSGNNFSVSGFQRSSVSSSEDFWALRDVSFEVRRGDVVGIIGRNGAGKSTLLKILSRITEPTTGRVEIDGRVASLLEVGTGFHPELTGRENIYLNGAILGMRRAEIKRKFDEIVAFAEVEKFLDTPVKHYSSGMYVRLAFAVAAHLEPEILIVDEVLAVGDAQFQKKCLGKMGEVAKGGRTVLFVSHNMAAVQGLCNRAILLDHGTLALDSDVQHVILHYGNLDSSLSGTGTAGHLRNRGTKIQVASTKLLIEGIQSRSVRAGDRCTIEVTYRALGPEAIGKLLSISLMLYVAGQKVVNLWSNYRSFPITIADEGTANCVIERWPFRGARMHVDVYCHIGDDVQDWIEECLVFESFDGDYYGSGIIAQPGQGIMFLDHKWNTLCQ